MTRGGVVGVVGVKGRRLVYEDVSEQLVGRGPGLALREDALQEVTAVVGGVGGQHGVGGLGGDLEDGRHGLVLRPGGALGQHLHHRAPHAPVGGVELLVHVVTLRVH